MWPAVSYRSELPEITRLELDALCALLQGHLASEHDSEGHHTDVTADSVTVTERAGSLSPTTGFVRLVDSFGRVSELKRNRAENALDIKPGNAGPIRIVDASNVEQIRLGPLASSLSMGLQGYSLEWESLSERWGWGSGTDAFDDFMAPISFDAGETPFKIYRNAGSSIFQISPPTFGTYTHKLGDHTNATFEWDEIAGKEVYARTGYYERSRSFMQGDWTAWTPTWTGSVSNPSIGAGGIMSGFYTVIGNTLHFQILMVMASSTSFGSGQYSWSLPPGFTAAAFGDICYGSALLLDSGTTWAVGACHRNTDTTISITTTSPVGSTFPWTWADNDRIHMSGTIRIV